MAKWYVVDVQQICIVDSGADFAEANTKADARVRSQNLPARSLKVMTKPRVGTVNLDPNDEASWRPRRAANPAPRGARRNPIVQKAHCTDCGETAKTLESGQEHIFHLPKCPELKRQYEKAIVAARKKHGIPANCICDVSNSGRVYFKDNCPVHQRAPRRNPDAPTKGSLWMLRAPTSTARRQRVYEVTSVYAGKVEYKDAFTSEIATCPLAQWYDLMTQAPEHTRNPRRNPRLNPRVHSARVVRANPGQFTIQLNDDELIPERFDTWDEAVAFGKKKWPQQPSWMPYELYDNPGELMVVNPGDGGLDSGKAAATFELWHKKTPRNVKVVRPRVKDNDEMLCIGKAREVTYRSGKWQVGNKTEDYFHVFDSKPKVWMLASVVNEDMRTSGTKLVGELLKSARNADGQFACADLATPLSFTLDGDGDTELKIHRGARLLGAIDKKTIIILDPVLKLVVIRGGEMHFDERGIVK